MLAGIAAVVVALEVRRRFSRFSIFRGLDVLAHTRERTIVGGLMLLVIATQVIRTLVVLQSVGLKPSLLQAVATFVAAGVLSSLFAGPGAGTAGGPLLVFGHNQSGRGSRRRTGAVDHDARRRDPLRARRRAGIFLTAGAA